MRKDSRFLIVGGTGFIGSHFTDALLANNEVEKVILCDNFSSGRKWHYEKHINAVVDQLAAAAREDGRAAGKVCPLPLAVVGREPSDAAPVRKHAAAYSGFAAASREGAAARRNQPGRRRGDEGEVSEKSLRYRHPNRPPGGSLFGRDCRIQACVKCAA